MQTLLAIRHFPDRKKPCLMLEQGNEGLVVGYIRNAECERLINKFFGGPCSLVGDMDYMFEEEEDE